MSLIATAEIQQELATIAASLRASTVVVRTGTVRRRRDAGGQGSGIVWDADGTIVTNAHVATSDRLTIETADGVVSPARLVARDARRDLAILRVDATDRLTPATRGDPTTLRPGQLVVAHGHPLGVAHSLALGVVHTIGRASWQEASIPTPALIHTDIRLAPGNSGGPLADVHGRVVGVNAMIVGGVGVAVSTDEVRRILLAGAPRPTLGATLRTVATGLLVLETTRGGAADRAGILPGDVLVGHAGRPFRDSLELITTLHDAGEGGTLRLDVLRAGERVSCVVELGAGRRAA